MSAKSMIPYIKIKIFIDNEVGDKARNANKPKISKRAFAFFTVQSASVLR